MIGGQVIENIITNRPERSDRVRRLWAVDRQGDEAAVYADIEQAKHVQTGDQIWWQSGTIFWTTQCGSLKDVPLGKIGFSFDPNKPQ